MSVKNTKTYTYCLLKQSMKNSKSGMPIKHKHKFIQLINEKICKKL